MRWHLWCFCLLAKSYETINHWPLCTCGERRKHLLRTWTLRSDNAVEPLHHSKQNKTRFTCQLPTMRSTCLHRSLSVFLKRLLTPVEYYFRVISTQKEVVARWSLAEMSTDEDWTGLDLDWSQIWPNQDWIGLQFFLIGGSGLDRTEKFLLF